MVIAGFGARGGIAFARREIRQDLPHRLEAERGTSRSEASYCRFGAPLASGLAQSPAALTDRHRGLDANRLGVAPVLEEEAHDSIALFQSEIVPTWSESVRVAEQGSREVAVEALSGTRPGRLQ